MFSAEEVANQRGDAPWLKSETDKMLDLYLAGAHPGRISAVMQRTAKSLKRQLETFSYNEKGRVARYQPKKRQSRVRFPVTKNELVFIRSMRQHGAKPEDIARVVQREVREVTLVKRISAEARAMHAECKQWGAGVDLVMAYRYLYYCKGISIVSDKDYDELEQEEVEFGANGEVLKEKVGSDKESSYPPHIRALACYLVFKYSERE